MQLYFEVLVMLAWVYAVVNSHLIIYNVLYYFSPPVRYLIKKQKGMNDMFGQTLWDDGMPAIFG